MSRTERKYYEDQSKDERYDRALQLVQDQQNLDELLADAPRIVGPAPTIHEPVVMTRRARITIHGEGTRIDSFVKLEGGESLSIGAGVHVASFAHVGIGGGTCVIGDYCAIASGAKIISGSNEIDRPSMSASAPENLQSASGKTTVLERYAAVLTNAVVLPGVTLHEGAILAAGAVATKDIPAWEIWAGVPARFIAKRVVR